MMFSYLGNSGETLEAWLRHLCLFCGKEHKVVSVEGYLG